MFTEFLFSIRLKAMVFPVVMYRCESRTIKKAECWRIDAFEMWYWRRLLRVPWTARRSNQSILKEISLGVHWKDWCWSWNLSTLASWCQGENLEVGSRAEKLFALSKNWLILISTRQDAQATVTLCCHPLILTHSRSPEPLPGENKCDMFWLELNGQESCHLP